MGLKFEDPKELEVGTHEPCLLDSVKRHEPSEEALVKYPDMKPYYAFRFVQQGGEYDGYSSVRFCTETSSKLGNLYQFVCDLNGGEEPVEFDPKDYEGRLFRIRVRKKANSEKLHVSGADPLDDPVPEEKSEIRRLSLLPRSQLPRAGPPLRPFPLMRSRSRSSVTRDGR